MSVLLSNLLRFAEVLRGAGVDVQAGRMLDVAAALEHVDIGRRSDFHVTLQTLLIHRVQDLPIFDEAFRAFWRAPHGERSSRDLSALGEQRRTGTPRIDLPAANRDAADETSGAASGERIERIAAMTYSAREAARHKNFAELDEDELRDAEAAIARLTWNAGVRRTRRWHAARRGTLDVRRVVRRNLRHGGELVTLPRRRHEPKPRPLIVICDVSGSMERYARLLLQFIGSLAERGERVEAFVFATRLTRITRELSRREPLRSVPSIPRVVPDWAGGTRIGDALRAFNVQWARRVMGRGPVVLLISDGWDRGEPAVLAREMGRLQRSCHRLIWLNPLLGSPGYQPLTRGMQAAWPFIDDFLPVHNLASLEMLATHLNRLPHHARPEAGAPGPRTAAKE